jgi:hypothetical protein
MIGPRAAVGISVLSALIFCVLGAQNASAAKSTNTTGFTCISEPLGKGDFKDAHCDQTDVGKGEFTHKLVPLNETVTLDATNEKVTESTKSSEPAVLKSKVAGSKVTIQCSTMKTKTANSKVHNVETEKKHTFTGNGAAEFTNCEVKELTKCVVKEPIVVEATFEGAEGLGAGGNEMGVEYKGAGEGGTFTTIEFKNKGAEACAVNGKSFSVTGSVTGTSGPTTESSQTNKSSGATIVFTPKNAMQSVKLATETAELTLIATPLAANGGPPISITTVT